METLKVNTKQLESEKGKEAVRSLMFNDGFGKDEALEHAQDYARELVHGGATPTAITLIKRHINAICRGKS